MLNISLYTPDIMLSSDLKELIRVVQPLEDKDRDYISSYEEYFSLSFIGLNAWLELHDREIIHKCECKS